MISGQLFMVAIAGLSFVLKLFTPMLRSDYIFTHSVRKDLTGFATAAFIAW